MDERRAHEEKFAAHINRWAAQLVLFEAKTDQATAQAKIDYGEMTESLQHKHDEVKTRLQELKHASDEAWIDLKKGADKAWTEVETAFHTAASKFD